MAMPAQMGEIYFGRKTSLKVETYKIKIENAR
jgi:hypothetical protein